MEVTPRPNPTAVLNPAGEVAAKLPLDALGRLVFELPA